MFTIHAERALLPEGWSQDVRLTISQGRITAIQPGTRSQPADELYGTVVAGMPNLHSHAFQRGMAGLAEVRGRGDDSFWSWRDLMYKFALSMTPEQVQTVASQAYVEMLENGFTRVGEFHYLHHAPDGGRYDNIAEMAARIAAAVETTGIGLTLLPVFYARSGFGGTAPTAQQRRFISNLEDYARLLDCCGSIVAELPGGVLGVAPHSLRAVTSDELSQVIKLGKQGPIHIHIAEQVAEVEACLEHTGQRPVEWLLASHKIDDRWCLVHATHLTEGEIQGIAKAGAVVGLCPVTEANLGDGTFPASLFLEHGGRVGIGSDSNILISVSHELRQIEYSQRLKLRCRNVLARAGCSTGRELFDCAAVGGSVALRAPTGLAVGNAADIVSLRHRHDLPITGDQLLDCWIFAEGVSIDAVWVHGRKQVEEGHHRLRDQIEDAFLQTMKQLLS